MNHRVLELLKAPKNIQSEDLNLLREEINSFPYVQNIRALYLYGVNLYDKENYQKVLSTTAAYTTDKKILYQLINGKIQQKPQSEIVKVKPDYPENPLKKLYQSKVTNFPIKREDDLIDDIETEKADLLVDETSLPREVILPTPLPEIKHLYVNGERNRILFEGEENFLEDDQVETIDLESTLESGSIITQKTEKKEYNVPIVEENSETEELSTEIQDQKVVEEIEESEFTPETIIEEENGFSEAEQEEVLDESKLNFQETEFLVPENQNDNIEENNEEEITDHESEASEEFTPETIIEEENISSETEKEEILDESEVSFHETESFALKIQNDEVEENLNEEESEQLNEVEETAEFTPEKIINEDKISSEKEQKSVNDSSELSFHGTESFLPDVKIQPNNSDQIKEETVESNINKHEDEMRRLIEEVEKKMREKADSEEIKKAEEPETETLSHDISFAETQSFEVKPVEKNAEKETQDSDPDPEIIDEQKEDTAKSEEVQTSWKPMSFEAHIPDSMINKSVEIPQPKVEEKTKTTEEIKKETPVTEEILPAVEEIPELIQDKSNEFGNQTDELQIDPEAPINEELIEEKKDAPVMNVSFFGSDISKLKSTESQQETKEEVVTPAQKAISNPLDSNVPGFINTWQSWLKIDRAEETEQIKGIEEDVTEVKNKVIETFIENNPKISQLRDESSYIVKEKNDDISHLMTETLASLYFEQKLYTKAVKAFEILIKKNPEKKEYFEGKIQEIKDFRSR
ncbi:hypothetical protein ASG22_11535 [Chryseobacterium sp. Leaf405]|uniref:hypothetical protein n=1 Tax=Chryseobacterium sp. Leaf405 TaxID=1736367 RepID=UPI0006FBABEF|nr:hypothetical protein [Chryseobacterium sp. Leaf405]KQT24618.1 hypothetical protein ASG22_11535 [Chryseobacterium sp. Leaf405]